MNQPIPRSFFKDGQKAILDGRHGEIYIRNNPETIFFIEDCIEDFPPIEVTLLRFNDTLYTGNDLELLDRTIDQVMEGDIVVNKQGKRFDVIGRAGSAVFLYTLTEQQLPSYRTVNVATMEGTFALKREPQTLTAERAKELREESMKRNKYREKGRFYLVLANGEIDDLCHNGGIMGIGMRAIGNYFPYTPEGRKQAEEWRDKYLPAFLFEQQNQND